jgi:hypothetical protein
MDPVYKELREKGVKPPEGIFFMKQKISNACGTFSLFHAICQNVERIDIGTATVPRLSDPTSFKRQSACT